MRFRSKVSKKVYEFSVEEWNKQLTKNGGQFFEMVGEDKTTVADARVSHIGGDYLPPIQSETPKAMTPVQEVVQEDETPEESFGEKPLNQMDSDELKKLLDAKGVKYDKRLKSTTKLMELLDE